MAVNKNKKNKVVSKFLKQLQKGELTNGKVLGSKLDVNEDTWHNRLLIATPSTGLVRMEWAMARFGQIIPTNWSYVEIIQWINNYVPMQYLLPDAENLIAKTCVEGNFEWMLSIEEDNVLPPDAFVRLNEYMKSAEAPVVSGLYFTKSNPPEPIMYRGRGTGPFEDFKMGEKVWVDGIPFGFTLIHGSIIRALWDEAEEYTVNGQVTRRVFDAPAKSFGNASDGATASLRGTSDLAFCTKLMEDKIFEKAGWPEFQKKKYPFLVDTNIFLRHIDQSGRQYPIGGVPDKYIAKKKPSNRPTGKWGK